MDLLGKFAQQAMAPKEEEHKKEERKEEKPNSLTDTLHGFIGGGSKGEEKEDALDKGIDWVQENILKQGAQNSESAAEQAKDKLIAQTIRDQYKQHTGKEFPIEKKEEEKTDVASALTGALGGFLKK